MASIKTQVLQKRREDRRELLWPGAGFYTWDRKATKGFTTIPRLLPLITCLIKTERQRGDPTGVYWDFWCRAFDDGMIDDLNEEDAAFASGYTGSRAVRTWREHVSTLAELGFILVRPEGLREFAHVLILDPVLVACTHYLIDTEKHANWWIAFARRAQDIGAAIPTGSDARFSQFWQYLASVNSPLVAKHSSMQSGGSN